MGPASLPKLSARRACARADVHVERFDALATEALRLDEAPQRVVDSEPQQPRQLLVRAARGRLLDQGLDRGAQGPVRREADVLVEPEAVLVEARDLLDRVVAAGAVVARVVANAAEHAEHGPARGGEGAAQLRKLRDGVTPEALAKHVRGVGDRPLVILATHDLRMSRKYDILGRPKTRSPPFLEEKTGRALAGLRLEQRRRAGYAVEITDKYWSPTDD